MKNLKLVLPSLCLIAALALTPTTAYGLADDPQGGSNSTRNGPPPPPPPSVQYLIDLLIRWFG
jgi:hypothetical protein